MRIWLQNEESNEAVGGIARVTIEMRRHLPKHGVEVVIDPQAAELIATQIMFPNEMKVHHAKKPWVLHHHGSYWAELDDKWESWCKSVNAQIFESARMADTITAPTEWVAAGLRRNLSRPIHVVPHGIDLDAWHVTETLGYVYWDKTRPDPICDPTPMNELAKRMASTGFVTTFSEASPGPNVKVVGQVPFSTAKDLQQAAGVYLATSKETFGLSILQSLASGVPVVGYAWGGVEDLVVDGKHGRLVPPGDIEALQAAVRWTLDHRAELVDACRARSREFTWDRAAAIYANLYEDTLERHRFKMQGPRVSIVVTAYKLEPYLRDCLDSVKRQTEKDFECIVVDDASPDACGAIAEEYAAADPRFKVIHNEANQYLAGARNTGIAAARSRYILPLDADDMLPPHAARILTEALDGDRSIGVAYGNVTFTKEDGRTLERYGAHPPGRSGWPVDFVWENQGRPNHSGHLGNQLPYASMFRREAWEYTGGYRRRLRTHEDADFWLRVSSYGWRPKMVTEADTLIYRNREGSMSRAVAAPRPWNAWFPWAHDPRTSPAGAVASRMLPVPSLDPPAISVVIPVGPGHEDLFMDAVDSVDAQFLRWWECIVVWDTGAPEPRNLPPWVTLVPRGTWDKRGPAHARNRGAEIARGRWLLFLDADDMLEPRALEIMFRYARGGDDYIYSDFWDDVDDHGQALPAGQYKHMRLPDYQPNYLAAGMYHAVTCLMRKKMWEEIRFDETIEWWEDWAFFISAASKGYCGRRLPLPLFTYRKHTGMRAGNHALNKDVAKAAIEQRFHQYTQGGEQLMACRTCGNKAARVSMPVLDRQQLRTSNGGVSVEGMTLVEYIGEREGSARFRGTPNAPYVFAKGGPPVYVMNVDLPRFQSRADFRVVTETEVEALRDATPGEAPALVSNQDESPAVRRHGHEDFGGGFGDSPPTDQMQAADVHDRPPASPHAGGSSPGDLGTSTVPVDPDDSVGLGAVAVGPESDVAEKVQDAIGKPLSKMTKAELEATAAARGVDISSAENNDERRALINAADEAALPEGAEPIFG